MGIQQPGLSLDEAFARTQRGNLIYAEIVARKALAENPENLAAHNLLGLVAARAGLIGPAEKIFRRVHAKWPQAGLGATLGKIEAMLPAWREIHAMRDPKKRFLLIKAWGYGFCSDLGSLLGTLLLAELSARTPVIHWGTNCLYSDGSGGDSFRHFFEPINALTIDDLGPIARGGIFPGKWTPDLLRAEDRNKFDGPDARLGGLYFLERDEPVVVFDFNCNIVDLIGWIPEDHPYFGLTVSQLYRLLWTKYLKLTPRVTDHVQRFVDAHWPRGPVLAVHVRDGDHRYEQTSLLDVNAQYFDLVDRLLAEQPASLYLMTDTISVLEAFKARYGDRVFATEAQRTPDDTGIHYRAGTDRVQLGVDVLSDVLLATRADRFVGNGRSNPSCTAWQLKDWAPGSAHMIVPSFHEERNLFLHNW